MVGPSFEWRQPRASPKLEAGRRSRLFSEIEVNEKCFPCRRGHGLAHGQDWRHWLIIFVASVA